MKELSWTGSVSRGLHRGSLMADMASLRAKGAARKFIEEKKGWEERRESKGVLLIKVFN
jgi:hypothetical protein